MAWGEHTQWNSFCLVRVACIMVLISPYDEMCATYTAASCLLCVLCCCAVAGVAATCIKSGVCAAGIPGAQVFAVLQAAASERRTMSGRPPFGFPGDAFSTVNGKYYGNMVWAKF
jgi:hypothetical protein